MKKFVDRAEELATLEEQYSSKQASMVVIYGRRRVGKTTLISQFLKGKRGIYYLATEESEAQNRNAFKIDVAQFLNDELLKVATIEDWQLIFDRLTSSNERIVIAIDEFQYLGKSNPSFPSILQKIWDTTLSKRNVMLILCGSLISMMESQTLSYDSPLYGRRTAQIRMTQIPYIYYRDFFPAKTKAKELIERYSVTGGVPKYIQSFKDSSNIYDAINANVLNPNNYLYDEPNFLLSKELGEVGSYFSILRAISAGNRKMGEIAAALNVKQTSLSKYLKSLENLDILERCVPATESNPQKSKKGLYRIKDNYLLFWFRFVFPNLGLLETGHYHEVAKIIKRNFIDSQVAFVFEDICRELVWSLSANGEIPFIPERVGAWWGDRDLEFDVVAVSDSNKYFLFGECKYWSKPVGLNILCELEAKVERALKLPDFKSYKERPILALFSASGFTPELKKLAESRVDLMLINL